MRAASAPCRPAEFFHDLFETSVAEGELLTEVRIPKHTGWGAHYEKFVRVSHQWSIVGVAVDASRPRAARSARPGSG